MTVTERIEFQADGGSVHTWTDENGKLLDRTVFKVAPCLFMPWPPKTANERGIVSVTRTLQALDDTRKT